MIILSCQKTAGVHDLHPYIYTAHIPIHALYPIDILAVSGPLVWGGGGGGLGYLTILCGQLEVTLWIQINDLTELQKWGGPKDQKRPKSFENSSQYLNPKKMGVQNIELQSKKGVQNNYFKLKSGI